MGTGKIKVLIADDSQVTRLFLVHLVNSDASMQVVGTVNDGQAAVDFLASDPAQPPDVVLMDIHMPQLDGFEATRRIMETHPLPIVICTATSDPQELVIAFRSMEAGALACVRKPSSSEDSQQDVQHLLQTIRLMSEVRVVRRWPRMRSAAWVPTLAAASGPAGRRRPLNQRIVGIGASTGGPPVLQTILSALPATFPAPILIVQHIARGFLPGMVDWLNQSTALHVQIAAHGVLPIAGHVYLAPDDFHLGIGASGAMELRHGPAENGLRPAVSSLFRSLAEQCGALTIGVLLTGMGKDGAEELRRLKNLGALTIAQDRDSSVVHGMPGEAIALGAATHILAPERIAPALLAELNRRALDGEGGP